MYTISFSGISIVGRIIFLKKFPSRGWLHLLYRGRFRWKFQKCFISMQCGAYRSRIIYFIYVLLIPEEQCNVHNSVGARLQFQIEHLSEDLCSTRCGRVKDSIETIWSITPRETAVGTGPTTLLSGDILKCHLLCRDGVSRSHVATCDPSWHSPPNFPSIF